MASYAEIQAQIAQLQKEAQALRNSEIAAVIADIKAKIAQYGLSARDLGLISVPRPGVKAPAAPAARFVGPNGERWSGRGRRPEWLRNALDGGMAKSDFAV